MDKKCGSCGHHIPNSSSAPCILTSGEGKGRCAYWVCELTSRGKYSEDGKHCSNYLDKYKNNETLQEWRDKVYSVKTHHKVKIKELV